MTVKSSRILTFGLFFAGIIIMFAPVHAGFSQIAWGRDENAHAPFVLAIILGAIGLRVNRIIKDQWSGGDTLSAEPAWIIGSASFAVGLALYIMGVAGEVELFLSLSLMPIAIGGLMIIGGMKLTRQFWFPLAMMFYLIIWPGWLIDQATAPLKLAISDQVTALLSSFGMPVAHSGVVIAAGPYQLLVADACSGLNSLVAMTAVGAVYLYIVKRRGIALNAILFLSLIPIAILANFIRVALLIWITLAFGYDAGQGFLHDFAGLVMFGIALSSLFLFDSFANLFSSKPTVSTRPLFQEREGQPA